jgi:hypothetical protein
MPALGVKIGKAQCEHMFSAVQPITGMRGGDGPAGHAGRRSSHKLP